MSLKKKPNTLLLNTIIKYNMNKRSEQLFQKSTFSPPVSDKFLNFFILTLSALSRSCQFLPLSDRTNCRFIENVLCHFDIFAHDCSCFYSDLTIKIYDLLPKILSRLIFTSLAATNCDHEITFEHAIHMTFFTNYE